MPIRKYIAGATFNPETVEIMVTAFEKCRTMLNLNSPEDLPQGLSATPGPVRLFPYQRGIAEAIADPKFEPVSVLKSAHIGYTALLTGALAHFVVREPSPILVLMPTLNARVEKFA